MLIDLTQPEYIDIYQELSRKYYEFYGNTNIILFMIQNNMRFNSEYKEYFVEYLESFKQYELCKKKFANLLIEKNPNILINNWEVLFEKDAVKID